MHCGTDNVALPSPLTAVRSHHPQLATSVHASQARICEQSRFVNFAKLASIPARFIAPCASFCSRRSAAPAGPGPHASRSSAARHRHADAAGKGERPAGTRARAMLSVVRKRGGVGRRTLRRGVKKRC
jgi:hypothetical protein